MVSNVSPTIDCLLLVAERDLEKHVDGAACHGPSTGHCIHQVYNYDLWSEMKSITNLFLLFEITVLSLKIPNSKQGRTSNSELKRMS